MKIFLTLFLAGLCIHESYTIDYFTKDCCKAHDDYSQGRVCNDMSRAPWTDCCGHGRCNLACCECDGGCKGGDVIRTSFFGDITPNIGFTGFNSAPAAAGEFIQEAVKNAAIDSGKAGLAIYNKATEEVKN